MASYLAKLFTFIITIYQGTYSVHCLLCVITPQFILGNRVATFFGEWGEVCLLSVLFVTV